MRLPAGSVAARGTSAWFATARRGRPSPPAVVAGADAVPSTPAGVRRGFFAAGETGTRCRPCIRANSAAAPATVRPSSRTAPRATAALIRGGKASDPQGQARRPACAPDSCASRTGPATATREVLRMVNERGAPCRPASSVPPHSLPCACVSPRRSCHASRRAGMHGARGERPMSSSIFQHPRPRSPHLHAVPTVACAVTLALAAGAATAQPSPAPRAATLDPVRRHRVAQSAADVPICWPT